MQGFNAPNRFDIACELVSITQPLALAIAGGPAALSAFLATSGVGVPVALPTLPWWGIGILVIYSFMASKFLQWCQPTMIQLPTTANRVRVTTPALEGHPSTTIDVGPGVNSETTSVLDQNTLVKA